MKILSFITIACSLLLLSCSKESSNGGSTHPLMIAVTGASPNLSISTRSFASSESLSAAFTTLADSVGWAVSDTVVQYPGDTIPIINANPPASGYPGDTIPVINPNPPASGNPGDTIPVISAPPYDSVYSGADTLRGVSSRSNSTAGSVQVSFGTNQLLIRVSRSGNFQVTVYGYRRNSNGSLTLIRAGYIQLSAH